MKRLGSWMLKKFTKSTGDDYVWLFESTVCMKSL